MQFTLSLNNSLELLTDRIVAETGYPRGSYEFNKHVVYFLALTLADPFYNDYNK